MMGFNVAEKTRICRICKRHLVPNKFVRRAESGTWRYRTICKECMSKRQCAYRKKRKAAYSKKERRRRKIRQLKYKFKITIDEYEAMVADQSGGCAVCGRVNIDDRLLAVDHDHKTGKIRGLLCHSCNVVLGHVKDDPAHLRQLIAYLKRNK